MCRVRKTMESVLQSVASLPFKVVFWDGGERNFGSGEPEFVIRIKSKTAAANVLSDISLGFGEGYMDGEIDVEGDLEKCLSLAYGKDVEKINTALGNKARRRLLAIKKRNSLRGSLRNIAHHYDLGNDFYCMWLDPHLQYTCAYFSDPNEALAEAQVNKMDQVCRKLRLQEGQTLLETGCGWGGFAIFAAKRYGVNVKAYNISSEQIAYAHRRAREEGLSDRVAFIHDDYRNVKGDFDAFASVGMLEHVGKSHYKDLCRIIKNALKPNGRGLLHFIGKTTPERLNPWLTKYIFPGAYAPSMQELLPVMGRHELITYDVQNLRLHYARTLEHWLGNFERHIEKVMAMFDERFVRMWRFYLVGAIVAFK